MFSFDGPPAFLLNFTRQFEINDAEGDHDHYVQVHCELSYSADHGLRALGRFSSWFFHDGGEELDGWAAGVADHEVWRSLRNRASLGFESVSSASELVQGRLV